MPHTWSSMGPLLTGLAAVLLLAASLRDIASRNVPDWIAIALALLGLVARAQESQLLAGTGAGLAVFVAAALCWRRGLLGGADVKLLGAAATVVPPGAVTTFIVAMSLAGATHALIYLTLRCALPAPRFVPGKNLIVRTIRAERWRIVHGGSLPYVCAITAGFLFVTL